MLLFLVLFQGLSFAQTTVTTGIQLISGASRTELDQDGVTWTVYGGIQRGGIMGSYGCQANQPCDTCVGGSDAGGDFPCNLSGVFADTQLQIHAVTNAEVTSTTDWWLCNGTNTVATGDIELPLSLTWSQVCAGGGSGGGSDCSSNVNMTLQFGPGTSCSGLAGSINIKFITKSVDVTVGSTYAVSETTCPSGACFFKFYPGDKKLYFDPDRTPVISSSFSSNYKGYVFFHKETGTLPDINANDLATFQSIRTADKIITMDATSEGDPAGSFIEGSLSNGVRYCFKMGVQDVAGNIEKISSGDCTANGGDCENVCVAPSEVVGLLSDKNCFIATAAFGSGLHPHVNSLRQFRNQFLVPYKWGRKFIKTYYKFSPPMAKWISQHEQAKIVVQGLLWPILGWVYLSLAFGWWGVLAPVAAFAGGATLIIRRRRL